MTTTPEINKSPEALITAILLGTAKDYDELVKQLIVAFDKYADYKLSEHSTKEPVAWLCEHENCRPEITTYKDIADNYMKYGYTITPLVKK